MQFLNQIFASFGLFVPFSAAGAVYAVFVWLDKNASGAATRALSGWIKNQAYRSVDVRAAIRSLFYRIYSYPLLRLRAFSRSATISFCVWLVGFALGFLYNLILLGYEEFAVAAYVTVNTPLLLQLIISDYLSIFVIARVLRSSSRRTTLILIAAFFSGLLIIILSSLISLFSIQILAPRFVHYEVGTEELRKYVASHPYKWELITIVAVSIPGMIVHSWLIMVAFGSMVFRLLFYMFEAARWMQWFLKRGSLHPLRAIGIISSAAVFITVSALKWI